MKATFFYDIRFMKYNEEYYSHYGVNDDLLKRYIDIFGELTYLGRNETITEYNKKYIINDNKINNTNIVTFKENYSDLISKVKSELKNTEFAIIRLPSLAGYVAQKQCEKYDIPYLVEVVGNPLEALWYHSLKTKIFALPIHLLMKSAIKNSKYVSYITDTYLQKCYPTKYTSFSGVANVSLPILENSILEKRLEKIKKMKFKKNINIGLIGALNVKYKGHKTAIKALNILIKKYPNIKLKLLGQGNKYKIEKLCRRYGVSKNVEFCGTLPGGQAVLNWLDDIDIYIQPSITEGHGRAAVEAMSRACITFASNVGGLGDSIDSKYLFDKKNYKELANFIINSIEYEEFAKEVAISSFSRAKKYENINIEKKRQEAFREAMKNIKKQKKEK